MKECDITIQYADEDPTGPDTSKVFAELVKRRQATDLRGAIKFNLGSLDTLPLASGRGFTPFRDMLMRKHLEAGGTLGVISMESEIDFDRIREGKNAMLREFNRRRVIAEKEGTIRYIPIKTVSDETFDRIQELSEQPAEPSQALVDLMTRKRKFKREY